AARWPPWPWTTWSPRWDGGRRPATRPRRSPEKRPRNDRGAIARPFRARVPPKTATVRCAPHPVPLCVSFSGPLMNTPNTRRFNVAVVGATGAVGEVMLSILAERDFPVGKLVPLASARSAGSTVEFRGEDHVVQDLATFDPAGIDIALFSAGGDTSKEFAPKFAAAGAVVIDNSSAFRYDDDVPLVVSEVNPEQVRNRPRGIIA